MNDPRTIGLSERQLKIVGTRPVRPANRRVHLINRHRPARGLTKEAPQVCDVDVARGHRRRHEADRCESE